MKRIKATIYEHGWRSYTKTFEVPDEVWENYNSEDEDTHVDAWDEIIESLYESDEAEVLLESDMDSDEISFVLVEDES